MKQETLRLVRNIIAISFLILFFFALITQSYKIPIFDYRFFPLLSRLIMDFSFIAFGAFIFLVLLTFLFGRVYCSFLCPLGLLQELFFYLLKPISKLNKKYNFKFERNRSYKYIVAAIFYGSLFGGSVFLAKYLEPYTIIVSASGLSKVSLYIIATLFVLVLLKSRFFCTNICPVGTVLGVVSKFAVFKIRIDKERCVNCGLCQKGCQSNSIDISNHIVNNETCVKCFKCLSTCKKGAIFYGKEKAKKEEKFSLERRKFLIGAVSVAVFYAAFRRVSYKVHNEIGRIRNIILPPGARSNKRFVSSCLNCNLCVRKCPQKIIKPKDDTFEAVHLDLTKSFCNFDCHICSKVCPAGALKKLSLEEKQQTKIANAVINESECIQCGLCVETCPKQAISKAAGEAPIVDSNKCIGCGKCTFECPVKTIKMEGIEEQQTNV